MAPTPSTYDELAQEVLRGYLRSAVIIDDQWPEIVIGAESVEEPDESAFIDDRIPADIEAVESAVSDVPPSRPPDNPRDAQLLADLQRSLLREGLLACGFRYTHQARCVAIELARRADIVVLDWDLANDDGADALVILQELRGNELRFVCIFTGHGKISLVRHAVEECLGEPNGDLRIGEGDLRIGNLVIAIRNKKGLEVSAQEFTVESRELLAEALRGLARNYNGLVQLAMLELTHQHRRQLPSILERFDKSIDTAVLLEAGDASSPVGQSGAFLAVLIDEWRAHLEQESSDLQALGTMGRQLFGAQLAKRLGEISEEDVRKALERTRVKTAKDLANPRNRLQLQEWLSGACAGPFPDIRGVSLGKDQRQLASWGVLQAISGAVDEESALPLLRLDALFHQQFELPEKLTQGTLVAVDQDSERADYYLCITPVCDAERPETLANLFTFLRTEPIPPEKVFTPGNRKAAYCVIEFEKRLLCLEVLLKQRIVLELEQRTFVAGTIQGCLTPGSGELGLVQLRRIAQLRLEHAFAITAAAAADAARVGVNRVELLRSRLSS
jgi:hypothetical protein